VEIYPFDVLGLGALESSNCQLERSRAADVLDVLVTPGPRLLGLRRFVNDRVWANLQHALVAAESELVLDRDLEQDVRRPIWNRGHKALIETIFEHSIRIFKRLF